MLGGRQALHERSCVARAQGFAALLLLAGFSHFVQRSEAALSPGVVSGYENITCPAGTKLEVILSMSSTLQFEEEDCVVKGSNEQQFKCFKFYKSLAAWSTAESRCVSLGGHLASMNSFRELEVVSDVVLRQYVQVSDCTTIYSCVFIWIGGTDSSSEGVFRWTDGSAFNSSEIQFSPSDSGSEDYLTLSGSVWGPNSFVKFGRNNTFFTINDVPSWFSLPSVCTFTGLVTRTLSCVECNVKIPNFANFTSGCDWECNQGFHKVISSSNVTCERDMPGTEPFQQQFLGWGSELYSHCQLMHTWDDIIQGANSQRFKTGGLGKLMVDKFESWVCEKNHSCAAADDPYFCFVYHEVNQTFLPWGPNKDLSLLKDK
eukprot:750928-Hanusia_phi.AAC.2